MVMPDNEVLFNDIRNGLYYHDPEDRDLILINTVEENREGFSYRELSGASEARRALAMFSYPSQKLSSIWYVPQRFSLSPLRMFAMLTLFTDAMLPLSKGNNPANKPSACKYNI